MVATSIPKDILKLKLGLAISSLEDGRWRNPGRSICAVLHQLNATRLLSERQTWIDPNTDDCACGDWLLGHTYIHYCRNHQEGEPYNAEPECYFFQPLPPRMSMPVATMAMPPMLAG